MATRDDLLWHILAAARRDPRIAGLLDYGSSSEGRSDEWSDVDVALYLRDEDLAAFRAGWKEWAAGLGSLLLAYVGGVGHPWTVYDGTPLPLRCDFNFWPVSAIPELPAWPNTPVSVEAMVLYDGTEGRLTAAAARLVGRSLAPPVLRAAFESVCGDFWYYLLRTEVKLRRGQDWAARYDFNAIVMGNLLALLRIEAGRVERWQASSAALGVERDVAPERLARLDACCPPPGREHLRPTLVAAASLGHDACAAISTQHGWPWPEELAARVLSLE